ELLTGAVEGSFNRMCVDNDMSTSDTVLCLANGQSGTAAIEDSHGPAAAAFAEGLNAICLEAAKAIVRDGEGATKFIEIRVSGAKSDEDALKAARAIAHSQLCKTAFFGQDPNWGRLACAAGYSGADFQANDLDIYLNDVKLLAGGQPADYQEKDAAAVMEQPEFQVRIVLGAGPGAATFWTSDLSHDYVSINADYRS
ncbi:MAG: bifunctional ornithine acetyltransferase/N-acetylglutamate synthase, partial [Candidatus Hydrogenedentes bacterium]|nr:bifunctional ornithine acetyltransferase/N-acetylglutamate synthase [Candidatus Hydrogenedentota bacterium]